MINFRGKEGNQQYKIGSHFINNRRFVMPVRANTPTKWLKGVHTGAQIVSFEYGSPIRIGT